MLPHLRGRARFKPSATNVNIVFDGNSIVYGYYQTTNIEQRMAASWPLAGLGLTVANLGKNGYTWRMLMGLDGGSNNVDSQYVAGRKNILVVMETTNSIYVGGRSGSQAAADAQAYVAARLAAHAWTVLLVTAPPHWVANQTTADANNAAIDSANAAMRANYRAWGAAACADIRAPNAPYAFPDYAQSRFSAAQSLGYFHPGDLLHPADAGAAAIAATINGEIARLPA